jgi:L-ascorbate metabolism protein UlaG (beta-lactamase superfamily)
VWLSELLRPAAATLRVPRRPAPSSATSATEAWRSEASETSAALSRTRPYSWDPLDSVLCPRHSGWRGSPGNGPAAGHVLQGSRSVYFADDTDVNPEIAELSGVDLALLPVGSFIAGIEEMPFH